jgi:hypothetical protein
LSPNIDNGSPLLLIILHSSLLIISATIPEGDELDMFLLINWKHPPAWYLLPTFIIATVPEGVILMGQIPLTDWRPPSAQYLASKYK